MRNIEIDNASLVPSLEPDWQFNKAKAMLALDNATLGKRFELNEISGLIVEHCDGKQSVQQIIDALKATFSDADAAIKSDVEKVLHELHQAKVLRFSPDSAIKIFPVPAATPRHDKHKLCIGMATYDDYDGVYFSVQAIRLYHPEVCDEIEILVLDNHPDGACAQSLKKLENWVASYRYIPCQDVRGTAVRDRIFHEANADYVMCIDSHVFIQAGAIKQLLDYFDANKASKDLLQGPMFNDDLKNVSTHFEPQWNAGMYGTWATDERALKTQAKPFDIPMQGLGLFACRKAAWVGFNPNFSGFGGEEGYVHEKFRQHGGRTLCLPFLRWLHRFERPMGVPYDVDWHDRIRNYLIGRSELGLDDQDVITHFREHIGVAAADEIIHAVQAELADG